MVCLSRLVAKKDANKVVRGISCVRND